MLLGIKDSSGLGNNADELKTASILFDNVVIRPLQEIILDAIDQVLSFNGAALNIYFKTLQPLEFKEEIVAPSEVVEESTGVEDSGIAMSADVSDEVLNKMFETLNGFGEDEDLDNWELVDERAVDYEQEEYLDSILQFAKSPKVKTGEAFPNAKSDQDGETKDGRKYKIRYSYAPGTTKTNSREFCKLMVKKNKVYRKEDIVRMKDQVVNEVSKNGKGFGPRGAETYDIWLYKGGARCHHFWMRKTYLAKVEGVTPDAKNPNADISVNQARKAGVKPETNNEKVAKRPVDMPNEGFLKPRK
jgi:hypothetical protein